MTPAEIFVLQLLLSLLVFGLLASWIGRPALNGMAFPDALFWLLIPHAFRHLGMVFQVPGVVSPELPAAFSVPAAYGDLAAGMLAILAIVALRRRWTIAVPLTWIFSVVGFADLANALTNFSAIPHLQSAWYIPTFIVPVLLVTHVMIFIRLISAKQIKSAAMRR